MRRFGPLLAICLLLACNDISADGDEYGPLATANGVGGDLALASGTLVFTDTCVFLVTDGVERLLVWPAELVRWNDDMEEISFTRPDGSEKLKLEDGQEVALGGGGVFGEEGDPSVEVLTETIDWVSEPDSSCVTPTWWFVTDLVP